MRLEQRYCLGDMINVWHNVIRTWLFFKTKVPQAQGGKQLQCGGAEYTYGWQITWKPPQRINKKKKNKCSRFPTQDRWPQCHRCKSYVMVSMVTTERFWGNVLDSALTTAPNEGNNLESVRQMLFIPLVEFRNISAVEVHNQNQNCVYFVFLIIRYFLWWQVHNKHSKYKK